MGVMAGISRTAEGTVSPALLASAIGSAAMGREELMPPLGSLNTAAPVSPKCSLCSHGGDANLGHVGHCPN